MRESSAIMNTDEIYKEIYSITTLVAQIFIEYLSPDGAKLQNH